MNALALAFLLMATNSPPLGLPEASSPAAVEADDEASEADDDDDDDVAEDGDSDDDEAEAGVSAPRLPPVDDCASDPEFTAFRDELQRAVIATTPAALLALVDEDVDVGGGSGRRRSFVLAARHAGREPVVERAGKALSLGCSREDENIGPLRSISSSTSGRRPISMLWPSRAGNCTPRPIRQARLRPGWTGSWRAFHPTTAPPTGSGCASPTAEPVSFAAPISGG